MMYIFKVYAILWEWDRDSLVNCELETILDFDAWEIDIKNKTDLMQLLLCFIPYPFHLLHTWLCYKDPIY